MEKFSYGLEFYRCNIYDLNNVSSFKSRVKEAEEIEQYFKQVIQNIEYFRKFILRSYSLNRTYRRLKRIPYIKGLVLANDYINFDDIVNFQELISNTKVDLSEQSFWLYMGYEESINIEDPFEEFLDSCSVEIATLIDENITEYEKDYNFEDELANETITLSIPEKIKKFQFLSKSFINEKIKSKEIPEEEIAIVKEGMNDWIKYALNSMQDIYDLNVKTLNLTDENVSKFI